MTQGKSRQVGIELSSLLSQSLGKKKNQALLLGIETNKAFLQPITNCSPLLQNQQTTN